jgi:phosphoglycerate dehydrogenase-like enzyme
MEELLVQSDIVSLHVPLNQETRGLMSDAQFALMKPSALLVNTCRGPVVDEPALIKALQEKQIAGAARDVRMQEPPAPDNPLLSMDNVVLSPHIAGVTRDTWARRGAFIFANLQRVWHGEAPQAVIA